VQIENYIIMPNHLHVIIALAEALGRASADGASPNRGD